LTYRHRRILTLIPHWARWREGPGPTSDLLHVFLEVPPRPLHSIGVGYLVETFLGRGPRKLVKWLYDLLLLVQFRVFGHEN
jgi:hypothetical protein